MVSLDFQNQDRRSFSWPKKRDGQKFMERFCCRDSSKDRRVRRVRFTLFRSWAFSTCGSCGTTGTSPGRRSSARHPIRVKSASSADGNLSARSRNRKEDPCRHAERRARPSCLAEVRGPYSLEVETNVKTPMDTTRFVQRLASSRTPPTPTTCPAKCPACITKPAEPGGSNGQKE